MLKTEKNIVSILYTLIKFCIIKLLRWNSFFFYPIERFSPSTMVNIHRGGRLELGKKVRAHSGTKISVTNGAEMYIGDNTAINYNCIFVARKKITVGNNCTFGPNVVMYDHDHDFKNEMNMNGIKFQEEQIVIGNNVWIGANVTVLKGSLIGDNAVIAAGTVVRGSVSKDSIAFNKKELITKKYK